MNILIIEAALLAALQVIKLVVLVFLTLIEAESCDITSWIQTITAVFSLILGVITIIIGRKYILSKRQNAKVGFYVNLLIFIKRFKTLLDGHDGYTAHLVDETIRKKDCNFVVMPEEKASKFGPVFTKLCDEFLEYISKAENNIAPEYSGRKDISEREEWNKWYSKIIIVVKYVENCKLIEQGIYVYTAEVELNDYMKDYNNFREALEYLEKELERSLDYPKELELKHNS